MEHQIVAKRRQFRLACTSSAQIVDDRVCAKCPYCDLLRAAMDLSWSRTPID